MARRETIGVSYELFRQVMHSGRIPRAESLLPILRAAQLPDSAIRALLSHLYPHLSFHSGTDVSPDTVESAEREASSARSATEPIPHAALEIEAGGSPGEMAGRLCAALSRVPVKGNEDLWEMAGRLCEIADRKVRAQARGRIEQPFLFGKEPEAIYQFLVRRGKCTPFMSRGENCQLSFDKGIDYRDRFRGALLGQAIGARMGTVTQGLPAEDVRQLFGRVDSLPG
ncbi:MAG TPA: hypothetical protein VIU29_07160, partial [Candidatus Deferrimicrobiaceae bacterium]